MKSIKAKISYKSAAFRLRISSRIRLKNFIRSLSPLVLINVDFCIRLLKVFVHGVIKIGIPGANKMHEAMIKKCNFHVAYLSQQAIVTQYQFIVKQPVFYRARVR